MCLELLARCLAWFCSLGEVLPACLCEVLCAELCTSLKKEFCHYQRGPWLLQALCQLPDKDDRLGAKPLASDWTWQRPESSHTCSLLESKEDIFVSVSGGRVSRAVT